MPLEDVVSCCCCIKLCRKKRIKKETEHKLKSMAFDEGEEQTMDNDFEVDIDALN